ncbi:MAG: thiol reductant ABC exporter subunit CydC [Solibacillus sp.]|uniref:thiol reductant ABC exporter subunit CydC n=1 Tax=Solibacillus sp. TaxID=1909654 RepID=UPI0033160CA8
MQELFNIILHEKKEIALALLAGAVSGITAVALFAQSGLLISQAALMPPFYIILILTAFLKVFGVVKSASKYAERFLSHRVTFRILSHIRLQFFDRLEPIASKLFNRYQSGDLLARITADVATLQNFFLRVVYPPLVALLVFICTVIFTTFFSVWIAFALLGGFLLVAVIIPAIFTLKKQHMSSSKHALMNDTAEFLYGFKELKHFHLLEHKKEKLLQLSINYSSDKRKEHHQIIQMQFVNQAATLLTVFVVIFIGAYFVSIESMEGLYLAMLILITLTVFETAIPLATAPYHYKQSEQAMTRLQNIPTTYDDGSIYLEYCEPYVLNAKELAYHYEEGINEVVRNITFTIEKAEKIAIVGPSGSGKSTLFQLLINGLKPTKGSISIHNFPYSMVDSQSLWQLMSVQLQHNHFFSGTIRDNLKIAGEQEEDEKLLKVLQRAQLPLSLDHLVYEKGENLSGGEKQRLAFARVLLKNSPIWLLDEPFTSLDNDTERVLFQEMLDCTKDKTVILITHKLTGLEKMDRIFVMQEGIIGENGHFDELIAQKGLFYEMWTRRS